MNQINRHTNLSGNIVAFCRYLREHGFFIGPNEEADSLLGMEVLAPFQKPAALQLCLQTTLCKTPQHLRIFPQLYKKYWQELDQAVDSKIKNEEDTQATKSQKPSPKAPGLQAIKQWLYGNKNEDITETSSYSDLAILGRNTYPEFDERELKEVFQLVQKLVRKIANRRSRRFSKSHRKGQIDLKRTIRKNILRHGELIEMAYQTKKKEDLQVLLICDVSKSMELYSRFLIQFMYAFQNLFPKISAFVFSTALHPISDELNAHSINESLQKVFDKVNDWSGGTRIGSALETFNEDFSHKHLNRKTLVMILSDGWDTGEAELLGEQMKKIHRKAMKVLWLNPLAASTDWKPEVVGMKAAMPYVDLLLPFHSIESLKEVAKDLKI